MNDASNIWFLEEVNLFEYFCPINGAEDRYQKRPKKSYKKGEFIYFTEDQSDKIYFIHEGAVKIASYTPEGTELIRAILHEGEVFGELALYGEETRNDYAQAVEDTELCIQGKEEVVGLMRDIGGFRKFLHKLMGDRIIYTQKRMEALLFKDARTRIADYIVEQALKNGRHKSGIITLRNYLTHQEIASYTGTSRQTVTTVLNQFREQGIIDFDRKKIIIHNMDELEQAA